MTGQIKSMETLQTEVDQIKIDLDILKKETSVDVKKTKAETIEKDVTATKEDIQKELDALKGLTDTESLENTKKLEAMLITLDTTASETILKAAILADTSEDKNEKPDDKKNRFKKQVDGFGDKAEDNHGRKNAGRIALGIGAGILVWKGIKALFGGNKKKSRSEKTFLEKAWTVTKVVATGGGIYYLIHGFSTGKWNIKDFFDWDKKAGYESNDPKKFDEVYEKESAENQVKYTELGVAVNDFFSGVYGSDTGETGSDMLGEQKTDSKDNFDTHIGTMPCVLDDASSDVGDILDGTSDFGKKLDEFGAKVSKDVGKEINPLNWFSGGGASEEDLAKLDSETLWKYQAYRKTLKIQVFLHQKEKVLVRRLVAEKLGITGYTTASEEEKKSYDEKIDEGMDDDDIMDAVQIKMESVYYNQKLTGVMAVLKKYDISNEEMVADTQQMITEVDQDKNDLIGTTLIKATASTDINSDATLKGDVSTLCTDFDEKINDEDNQLIDFDQFFFGLGDAWINMEAGDKQEVLKEIGYTEKVGTYSTKILAIKEKITNGTATKADMAELKKTIDDYYIFKKDIVLGISFVHEADDKGTGIGRTLMYLGGKMIAVLEWTYDAAGGGITGVLVAGAVAIGGLYVAKMAIKGGVKYTAKTGMNFLRSLPSDPGRLLPGRRYFRRLKGENLPMRILRRQSYKGDKGFKLFESDFKKGRIRLDEAQEVIDTKMNRTRTTSVDDLLKQGGYIGTENTVTEKKLIKAYFDKNKNFRLALKKSSIRTDVLSTVKEYDAAIIKFKTTEPNKSILLKELFDYARFKNGDELKGILNHIDDLDLSAEIKAMDPKDITALAKKLSKKISSATTLDEMKVFVKEVKGTVNAVNTTTPVVTPTVNAVNNAVNSSTVDLITQRDDVYKSIDAELNKLHKEASNIDLKESPIVSKYWNDKMGGLESFRDKSKLFTEDELLGFKKLKDLDFKATHIGELFALGEMDVSVKAALKEGNDVDGLLKVLAKDDIAVKPSIELIQSLEKIKVAKQTIKYGDEMIEAGEVTFKLLSKAF